MVRAHLKENIFHYALIFVSALLTKKIDINLGRLTKKEEVILERREMLSENFSEKRLKEAKTGLQTPLRNKMIGIKFLSLIPITSCG